MNTNNQDILNLVEVLSQLGLKHVVLSPGSRNAPLIKAFHQHKGTSCYSIVDERSAGFFALGIAQQIQQPVALVCTSGSALLNYGPAVVEAYYQRVPLLVISADRPQEWIGQGDGQAINQRQVFQNFSKGYFELKESRGHAASEWHNERTSAEVFNLAGLHPKGPVHLNVPLSEPLYGLEKKSACLKTKPTHGFQQPSADPKALKALTNSFCKSDRIMILVGQHHPDQELAQAIESLSKLPQVTVLTETTANLFGNGFVDQIDNVLATITEEEKPLLAPTHLITLGGMVVSKRLKQFLRGFRVDEHWHIDPAPQHIDTYQQLSHHLQSDVLSVVQYLSKHVKAVEQSSFGIQWKAKKQQAQARHEAFLKNATYSDLKVFEQILQQIPEGSLLQIGNSTPIRYVQLFNNKPGIDHYCNRGVSGIDGCTSTAAGAAVASKKPTVLISGDVSFLYDNNGLWNNTIPNSFLAIVINNAGGNIFRIIEGPDQFEEMAQYIETTHHLNMKPLAEMHGFRYLAANSIDSVKAALKQAYKFDKKTILEIHTPREGSPHVLKEYWKHLKAG